MCRPPREIGMGWDGLTLEAGSENASYWKRPILRSCSGQAFNLSVISRSCSGVTSPGSPRVTSGAMVGVEVVPSGVISSTVDLKRTAGSVLEGSSEVVTWDDCGSTAVWRRLKVSELLQFHVCSS